MGRQRDSLPLGIEQLLAHAAMDSDFARALMDNRGVALEASGIALTQTERAILRSLSEPVLAEMIAGLAGNMVDVERRAFLGKSTAVAALVLGGNQLVGCELGERTNQGDEGQKKVARTPGAEDKASEVSPLEEEARLRAARQLMADRYTGSLGIRPDRPVEESLDLILKDGRPDVDVADVFKGMSGVNIASPKKVKK